VAISIRNVTAAAITSGGPTQDFTIGGESRTPVGIWFIVTGALTVGTRANHARYSIGFYDGTNHVNFGARSEDGNASVTDSGRGGSETGFILLSGTTNAVDARWTAALISGGARITSTNFPTAAVLITVVCFFGEIDFGCGRATSSSSIDGEVDVDPGWSEEQPPQMVFLGTIDRGLNEGRSNHYRFAFGGAVRESAGVDQAFFAMADRDNVAGHKVGGTIRSNRALQSVRIDLVGFPGAYVPVLHEAVNVTFPAHNNKDFRLTTVDEANAMAIAWCAIRFQNGNRVALEEVITPTTNTTQTRAVGFRPLTIIGLQTIMVFTDVNRAVNNQRVAQWALGQWSASEERSIANLIDHSASTTDCDSLSSALAIDLPNIGDTDAIEVTHSSFSATGYTTSYNNTIGNRLRLDFVIGEDLIQFPEAIQLPLLAPNVARLITVVPLALALPLVVPNVERLVTVVPLALALPLLVPVVERLVTVVPLALALPLLVPVVDVGFTIFPTALALPLVVPSVARLVTVVPLALALPLVVPNVERLVTVVPLALALPLVVPNVARLVTVVPLALALPLLVPVVSVVVSGTTQTPLALAIPLVLPTVARLVTVVPLALAFPLVVPVVDVGFTIFPTALALPLVVPSVARLVTVVPLALAFPLVVPVVERLVTVLPLALELPLVVPAASVGMLIMPPPLELELVAPAVARLVTILPAALELELVVPVVARLVTVLPDALALPLVVPVVDVGFTIFPAPLAIPLVVPVVAEIRFAGPGIAVLLADIELAATVCRIVARSTILARTQARAVLGRRTVSLVARQEITLALGATIRRSLEDEPAPLPPDIELAVEIFRAFTLPTRISPTQSASLLSRRQFRLRARQETTLALEANIRRKP